MNMLSRIFIILYQLLTISVSLGVVLLLGRTALASLKTKRPGMDGIDTMVHTVFLGLFIISACILIKCGIAAPLRAVFF